MMTQAQLPSNDAASKGQAPAGTSNSTNIAIQSLHAFRDGVISRIERSCDGPWWLARSTLFCVLLSLFFAFPNLNHTYQGSRARATVEKIQDLHKFWSNLTPQSPEHFRVVAYRITVELIAHTFGFGIRGCFALHALSGAVLIAALLTLANRIFGDKVIATLLTAAASTSYAGASAFLEVRANFDGIALLLVVLAMLTRQPLFIAALVVMSGFTDERGVVAAGFVFLWWAMQVTFKAQNWKSFLPPLAVIAGCVAYLAIRLTIQSKYGLRWETGNFAPFGLLNNGLMGIWSGLEGLWFPVGLGVIIAIRRRLWWLCVSTAMVAAVIVCGAISVADMTRSMIYLLPCVFIAAKLLREDSDNKCLRNFFFIAAVISVIWPGYYVGGKSTVWLMYPLPVQLLRFMLKLA